jgi:porin
MEKLAMQSNTWYTLASAVLLIGNVTGFILSSAGAQEVKPREWTPVAKPADVQPAKDPLPAQPTAAAPIILDGSSGCPAPCDANSATASAPVPFGGPWDTRPKMTGDWMGCREGLREHGITLDVSSTLYYQGIASGGLQDTFKFSGRDDYLVNIDGEKAGLWKGLFINFHADTVYGESVNGLTGALMPVNTGRLVPIPSGDITSITGLKVTQALSEHFAVFAGKINTFDGFQQPFMRGTDIDAGFMNLANIFNPVIARTVPYSTWGAGAAVLVDGKPAASVMVMDTQDSSTTTGFHDFFNNGVTILAFGGLPSNFFGMPGVHVLFGTYSSGSYAETDGDAYSLIQLIIRAQQGLPLVPKISGSWSIFYQGQQTLWQDPCDSKRSWGLFGSLGLSDGNPNPIRWSGTVGVGGSSPIPGRKLDTFGISYYYLGLSSSFKNIAPRLLPLQDEQGVELFYNVAVTPWCHITPDLQVIDPARSRVDTSFVLGIRARFDF